MMTLVWLAVGLVCLVMGAESLVRGAARLATMPAAAPASPSVGEKSADGASMPAPAAQPSPREWIERIRALRKEGKAEESARQLAEFVAAYPAYVLPDDLKIR